MITKLVTLRDNDSQLFNVLHAYGPGSGIDAMLITLEDAESISKYGRRETSQTFDTAVDKQDLTDQARLWLNEHVRPTQKLEVELIPEDDEDIDVELGSVVEYYDDRSGIYTTGVVLEYDWEDGRVVAWLGEIAPNLINIISDATAPDREAERLGLPVPIIRAQRLEPGILVLANPFVRGRAQGVEIHASTTPDFEGTRATQRARGSSTRFELTDLLPSVRYYLKARAYDERGEVGDFSDEVTVVSGTVKDTLDPTIQEDIDNAAAQAAVVVANKDVWDRAQAIETDFTLLVSKLKGLIERTQLEVTVRDDLLSGRNAGITAANAEAKALEVEGTVQAVEDVLNSAVSVTGQYAAILELDGDIDGVVAKLNDDPNAADQFTAISQTAGELTLVAAEFKPFSFTDEAGNTITTESGDRITSQQRLGADSLGVTGAFSELKIQSDRVDTTVTRLGNPNDPAGASTAFSRINQTADEIQSITVTLGKSPDDPAQYSSIKQASDKITTEVGRVEGALNSDARANDYSSITQTIDLIDSVVVKLGQSATDPSQYSSIKQTYDRITSEVGRVEGTLGNGPRTTGQYSAITQTIDEIDSVVVKLGQSPSDPSQYSAIKQTFDTITSEVARIETDLDGNAVNSSYTSIKQNYDSITSTVTTLNSDNKATGQFSAVRQTVDELEAVVVQLGKAPNDPNQYSSVKQNFDSITSTVAQIDNAEAILNGSAVASGQYSSISQTATTLNNTVATLNASPDDPDQFTSISQNSGQISLVAAEFKPFGLATESGDTIVTESGDRVVSDQNLAEDTLGIVGAFARIDIESDRITNTVSLLGNPNDPASAVGTAFSRINQTVNEIDLRVKEDEVVSSINLSTEGIRISGDRIQLNGDVNVTGDVAITDSSNTAYGFESRDASNELKAKFGNITGLPGVPSGNQYGFYGALGSGVFINGALRSIVAGRGEANLTRSGANASLDLVSFNLYYTPSIVFPDPIVTTVADQVRTIVSIESISAGEVGASGLNVDLSNYKIVPEYFDGSTWRFAHVAGKTLTQLRFRVDLTARCFAATTGNITGSIFWNYLTILEGNVVNV